MTYLAGQIFLCLLIAAVIGGIIGWLLKSLASHGRISRLESDLESAQADTRFAIGERDALGGDLDVARGQLREVEESLASLSGEKANLAEELEDAQARVSGLEASLQTVTEAKSSLAGELEGSNRRATELTDALAAMTEERDRAVEAKASAAVAAGGDQEALTALRNELGESRSELAQARADLARCRDQLGSASAGSASAGSAAPVVTPMPLVSAPQAPPKKDDLKKVEGIGPKIEGLLNDAGIATWAELAATPVDRLLAILAAAGERYRIHDPSTWPQQAELAAAGRWDELEGLQERLDGGREG